MVNAIVRILEVVALLFGVMWGGLLLCVIILKWIPESVVFVVSMPRRMMRRRRGGRTRRVYWLNDSELVQADKVLGQNWGRNAGR